MAILFDKTFQNLYSVCIIWAGSNLSVEDYSKSTWAATIYGGVQPSAAAISAGWTNYNSNYLVHIAGFRIYSPNIQSSTVAPQINIFSTNYGSGTGYNNGTAEWAILWPTNPTATTIQGPSLPSTSYILCPVSSTTGTGVVRLTSTTITVSASYQIAEFVLIPSGGVA